MSSESTTTSTGHTTPDLANETREGASARRGKAVALMASGTLISRVLGFVRTAMLAIAIGSTTYVADIFEKSNTMPTIIFMLLAGGVFNVILVPQLIKASKNADRGSEYTSKLLTLTILVMAAITAVLMAGAPALIRILSAGWSEPMITLGTIFTYWCMPQVFFYGVYAVAGQVLNAHHRFGAYMWAPVANNVIQLAALGTYLAMFGAYAGNSEEHFETWSSTQTLVLAGGATAGVTAQALVLLWPLKTLGLKLRPNFRFRGMGLRKVGRMAAWTLLAMAIGNIVNLYTGKVVSGATAVRAGNPSVPGETAFNQAQLIVILPHSLFALSLATVLFNEFSNAFSENRAKDVGPLLSQGLRTIAVPMLFSAVALITLAGPLGRLFGGTSIHAEAAGSATAILITLMAIGLPWQSYNFFLLRVFYAKEDTFTPMLLQTFYSALTLTAAIVIAYTLPWEMRAQALCISFPIAHISQTIVAHLTIRKKYGSYGASNVIGQYIKIGWCAFLSGLIGAALAYSLGAYSYGWAWSGYLPAITTIAATGIVMLAAYIGILKLARIPELDDFLGPVLRKLKISR